MAFESDQDLLKTLLELLPQQEGSQIISKFIDVINRTQPVSARLLEKLSDAKPDEEIEEIHAGRLSFGWIAFSSRYQQLVQDQKAHLADAVQLLGLMLENQRLSLQADGTSKHSQKIDPIDNELISGAGEGIFVCDRNLHYLVWNRFMEQLTGIPSDQILGKKPKDMFPQLEMQGAISMLQRALDGETLVLPDLSYHLDQSDKTVWISSSYRPQRNEQGEIVGVVGNVRDITSRKQAEEALIRERDLLARIMETSPAGIIILNREGVITFANERAEQVLQLQMENDPQEGRTINDWCLLDIFGQRISEENSPFNQVINTSQPIYGSRNIIEMQGDRQIPLLVNASPLFDGQGQVEAVIAIIEDISEQIHSEEALRESEERYALAASGSNDGIWDWDLKTGRVYYSARWKSIIGEEKWPFAEQIDQWFNRVHPGDYWQFKADIAAHLNGETSHLENEHRILHKDGAYRWVLARGMAVRDKDGKAYRIAGSLTDITRQKETEDQLRHDAMHDPLTHLPNRIYFIDQVRRAVERARRNVVYQGAVLYLDLDRFKIVNESLGHTSGDQLLVAIARRLQALIRPRDVISRFGGDEFAILLDDITGVGDATRIAQRIQEELAFPYRIQEHEIYPGASIGIAMISTSSIRAEDILRDADTAMYRAKAGGGGRHQVFGTEMHAMNVALFELEAELRQAVERNQFQLYYQPIVALETGKLTTVEALIRWHHPRRGLILPGEFIILAEETGLMLPIGEWVLRTACKQARAWHDAGFTDLHVAVNISPRQMQDSDLPALVADALQEANLPAYALQLEITEWAAMQNLDLTVEILTRLHDMGVEISIDDFGTSYSSLGYLKRFPVSSIKIDQSFVRDMTEDVDDAAITKAIIAMGKVLGLSVVAEGVEMEQQLAILIPEKCTEVQGDLMGRPVPGDAITTLLQEGHSLLPDMNGLNARPKSPHRPGNSHSGHSRR